MSEERATARSLWRGATLTCPRCGEGRLFKSYLKPQAQCPHCGERFEGLEADDGPAWLTIGIVAHIIVPLLIFLERDGTMSWGAEGGLLVLVTIVATLVFLPVSKGIFVAALWLIHRKEA